MRSGETGLQFEQLAFDANAAIDSLRPGRPFPHPLKASRQLLMPLFVLAELRVGVMRSQRREENAAAVDALVQRCRLLMPDVDTIAFYVRIRHDIERVRTAPRTLEKREGFGHDLWIAALCLQHDVPLLTNDALFDDVGGLRVVHW
jgi:tRNA(fMet)-specific endonuclease VapC